MAKIIAPNKNYTGISATVPFCNGIGETENPHLKEWFRNHGYQVEEKTDAEFELIEPKECISEEIVSEDEEIELELPETKETPKKPGRKKAGE